MGTRLFTIWDRLRSSYWFVPAIMAIAAIALALILVRLDEGLRDSFLTENGWVFGGGPEGARAVLSTIAGSVLTVAGTAFSITVAVLSLASNQFGPRLLRNFMRDTGNQVVLGTFTSTFLYCLLVLRRVLGSDGETYVPHVSVTMGVVLAVLSVGVLIYFIHHVAESIQVSRIIEIVGIELNDTFERLFPERGEGASPRAEVPSFKDGTPVTAQQEGYLQAIDTDTLFSLAREQDIAIHLRARPGDYIMDDSEIAVTSRQVDDRIAKRIRDTLTLGRIRTAYQDAQFAVLQVVEVAVRALSPGFNDPFTASMCIDRITSAMCRLAQRDLPSPIRQDDDGRIRMIATPYSYEDLTSAAYDQIWECARNYAAVQHKLRQSVQTVIEHARDPRFRAALSLKLSQIRIAA